MSRLISEERQIFSERADVREVRSLLGLTEKRGEAYLDSLPFSMADVTAGSESEYQTAVHGKAEDVDLPDFIRTSKYYTNISRRVQAGEMRKRSVHQIEEFLRQNEEQVWENSWVRFPLDRLKPLTRETFFRDLLADKKDPQGPLRPDHERFFLERSGERWVRVPVSYLLKLALVDALASCPDEPLFQRIGDSLQEHFLNDNSSPETYSFFPCRAGRKEDVDFRVTCAPGGEKSRAHGPAVRGRSLGEELSRETLLRFLLSQFALQYANRAFGLEEHGQKACLYFAPTTPLRMRKLNTLIADSFYRELFMSPCLSGWDRGYEKHQYMHLCHQVLSRSHLNSVFKLKESGILTSPLVRLDSISNTSLANNGTHVSLGSETLSALAWQGVFTAAHEKSVGDLAIKIFEHFLPLFPALYSGSPWHLDYRDMRPEHVASFLAHELTHTHLRMLWRRWIHKAGMVILGRPILPDGPEWYERLWRGVFRIPGIIVPDYRLTDYFVALLSTPESPALSGVLGNDYALKRDLASQGIFDEHMSVYLPVKLREFRKMGFSGFEARYYSVFASFLEDMAEAVDLQHLLSAFAFKWALEGRVTHEDIPDDPFTESERRQLLFASALGISTVNVRRETSNRFMNHVLAFLHAAKPSKRYADYWKIKLKDYRLALLEVLRSDPELVESLEAEGLLERLEERVLSESTVATRLMAGALGKGAGKSSVYRPGQRPPSDFNTRMELYYRNTLKRNHMAEALQVLEEELGVADMPFQGVSFDPRFFRALRKKVCGGIDPADFVRSRKEGVLSETLSLEDASALVAVTALYLYERKEAYHATVAEHRSDSGELTAAAVAAP